MCDFYAQTTLGDVPLEDLSNSHNMAEVYYKLLSFRYSRNEEELQELIEEASDSWQLPYVAIQEFIKPIVLVFNATCRLKETIGFIEYYWNNQSKYPQQYQISELDYKLLNLVITNEISNKEYETSSDCSDFSSSLTALEEDDFFNSNQTKRSEYMLNIAIEFINAICNGKFDKDFKLQKDLSPSEQLNLSCLDNYPIPLRGYEQYYQPYYRFPLF